MFFVYFNGVSSHSLEGIVLQIALIHQNRHTESIFIFTYTLTFYILIPSD
jgi:hypothetical protein